MRSAGEGRPRREVEFHAYPRLMFAWPIIILGFVLYPLDLRGVVRPDVLAWLWGGTLVAVLLAMGVRLDRDSILSWALLGAAIWLLGIYLRDARGLPQVTAASRFVADLDPPYPRRAALAFSAALLLPFLLCWAQARIDGKWAFGRDGMGRGRLSRGGAPMRGVPAISARCDDLPKFLLGFGGGSLVIRDREGGPPREIGWVFLLPRVLRRINDLAEAPPVVAPPGPIERYALAAR